MAMTLATLRTLVRQLVGDPQGSTYSLEMYQDAINFACKEYAKKTGVTYVETGVELDTSTGLCTIPTDYMRVNRVLVGGIPVWDVYDRYTSQRVESDYYSYGYSSSGVCFVFPSSATTLEVKPEVVDGLNMTEAFLVRNDGNSFPLTDTEVAFCVDPSEYAAFTTNCVDFHVIVKHSGDYVELKMRYTAPRP